jgi:hypothetical protein
MVSALQKYERAFPTLLSTLGLPHHTMDPSRVWPILDNQELTFLVTLNVSHSVAISVFAGPYSPIPTIMCPRLI